MALVDVSAKPKAAHAPLRSASQPALTPASYTSFAKQAQANLQHSEPRNMGARGGAAGTSQSGQSPQIRASPYAGVRC